MTTVAPEIVEVVLEAARAAAAALPSAATLVPGIPVTDLSALELPASAAVAVVAGFTGSVQGSSLVIVPADLVEALKASPLGELDVVAAVRPGLLAGAELFGQVVLDAGIELPIDVALDGLAGAGALVAVPLLDDGVVSIVYVAAVSPTAVPSPRSGSAVRNARGTGAGLELLRDVEMEVTAELGRTRMTVRELLSLTPGSVVELDRAAGSPADLLVNGTLIARGEVVVVDEEYGIRITELVGPGAEGVEGEKAK